MQQIPLLPVFRVLKAADETVNNSSTFQDDNELKFHARANGVFLVDIVVLVNSGSTPNIKFQLTLPSGASVKWDMQAANTSGSVLHRYSGISGESGTDEMNVFRAHVATAGTAGAVTLQWAQSTAHASDSKVLANSFLIVQQIDPVPVIPGLAHAPTP